MRLSRVFAVGNTRKVTMNKSSLIVVFCALGLVRGAFAQTGFTNVTKESGVADIIARQHEYMAKVLAEQKGEQKYWWLSGFTLVDLTSSGKLDLYLGGHGMPAIAGWNDGQGHFTEVDSKPEIKRGKGVILFTGATAGVKPFATSAAFGPAKFALRGLAQVMARDLQPQRIHVAYINVDGPIDMPFIRRRVPNIQEEDMLKPSAIAESYWHLAHQDPSAWTHELDVRPFKEKF